MNATLCHGGKVHDVSQGTARCGVGKNQPHAQWQMDLGEVTCGRCGRLLKGSGGTPKPTGGASRAGQASTAEESG